MRCAMLVTSSGAPEILEDGLERPVEAERKLCRHRLGPVELIHRMGIWSDVLVELGGGDDRILPAQPRDGAVAIGQLGQRRRPSVYSVRQ